MKCKYENVLTYYNFCNRECYYCTFDQKERCKMKHPEYFGEDKNAVKVFEVKKMTTKEMIETLRYKANNIKAKIEPEFFNEVADVLEKQVKLAEDYTEYFKVIKNANLKLYEVKKDEYYNGFANGIEFT